MNHRIAASTDLQTAIAAIAGAVARVDEEDPTESLERARWAYRALGRAVAQLAGDDPRAAEVIADARADLGRVEAMMADRRRGEASDAGSEVVARPAAPVSPLTTAITAATRVLDEFEAKTGLRIGAGVSATRWSGHDRRRDCAEIGLNGTLSDDKISSDTIEIAEMRELCAYLGVAPTVRENGGTASLVVSSATIDRAGVEIEIRSLITTLTVAEVRALLGLDPTPAPTPAAGIAPADRPDEATDVIDPVPGADDEVRADRGAVPDESVSKVPEVERADPASASPGLREVATAAFEVDPAWAVLALPVADPDADEDEDEAPDCRIYRPNGADPCECLDGACLIKE